MPKSNKIWAAIYAAALLPLALAATMYAGTTAKAAAAPAAGPTPTPPLNTVTIDQCRTPEAIAKWIEDEQNKGLVMDARPFAINQSVGRLTFSGKEGRITLAHMNPFAYNYRIKVVQEELLNTAASEFAKLLLPPNLGSFADLQSGDVGFVKAPAGPPGKLAQIASRIKGMKPTECMSSDDPNNTKSAACIATGTMYETFALLQQSSLLGSTAGDATNTQELATIDSQKEVQAYRDYIQDVAALRDKDADTYTTCKAAHDLNATLAKNDFATYLKKVEEAQKGVSNVRTLAADLQDLATKFQADDDLKDANVSDAGGDKGDEDKGEDEGGGDKGDKGKAKKGDKADKNNKPGKIRCKGYNCADQFSAYAAAAIALLDEHQSRLTTLKDNAVKMQKMLQLTNQMNGKEGLFARTSFVPKKFELSQATVSLNRTEIPDQTTQTGQTQSGSVGGGNRNATSGRGGGGNPSPAATGGSGSDGDAHTNSGGGHGGANDSAGEGGGGNAGGGDGNNSGGGNGGGGNGGGSNNAGGDNLAPVGQVNDVIQMGQPRFALSAGLVYSPLPRRTFTSVKGFVRDAQGKPTGDGSADVVGLDENSSRRILPMLMLNTRLTDFKPANLYFTWGISAKHDTNFDIEYLFGPSVGLLNNRAFFTFGAYGGQTQNLVADLSVGDALPDGIGDAKLYRKRLTWKPGFSFSYNFSRVKKANAAGGGDGGGGDGSDDSKPDADIKNELRIGSIPFNLALGVAYTSLEQHTYDEVVGFARDRQGNLTNGRTLTRIVGQTSSSSYRLTPLVLLHSRLPSFGDRLYFTTGVTGKKTDDNFDIEYLVGGSVNLYRRKLFLTFGGFAGKQTLLGGDFFEGAALGESQNVTTQRRYVWKPAFSFSYDITKVVKRTQ